MSESNTAGEGKCCSPRTGLRLNAENTIIDYLCGKNTLDLFLSIPVSGWDTEG